jgi:hypothetical protein
MNIDTNTKIRPPANDWMLRAGPANNWLLTVGGILCALLFAWAYWWWQFTPSREFRRDAVEAVAELNSFADTGACGGIILYSIGVERTDLAVHKAEAEVSNAADREAAIHLRFYYKALTDRDKACSPDAATSVSQYMLIELNKAEVEGDLGMNKSE